MKFTEHLTEISKSRNCGILTPPTTDREALYFLHKYLLGEDWYVMSPVGNEQVNTEMVHDILYKYSRKYRREYKKYLKDLKRK